mmetsp:Transcript_91037/g.257189  ORF Transcript_91037/g.257189 Transcript_91037/m.257189 type:complete len:887 (+) Transcript_91037:73-2733(+)
MSWFDQVVEQIVVSTENFAERAEVAMNGKLSKRELKRRFSTEACDLRKSKSDWFISCSSPELVDGGGAPFKPAIDELLRRWTVRLADDEKKESEVFTALLDSCALDSLVTVLAGSKDGRTAIREAAVVAGSDNAGAGGPLRAIYSRASAVPEELLWKIFALISETSDAIAERLESGVNLGDDGASEKHLQWLIVLLSTSMQNSEERAVCATGVPVESVRRAMSSWASFDIDSSTAVGLDAMEQQLVSAEAFCTSFNELKEVILENKPKASKKKRTKEEAPGESAIEKLGSRISLLCALREDEERIAETAASPQTRQMLGKFMAASRELEALLTRRLESVTLYKKMLPQLPRTRKAVAALCLECERIRRHQFEAILGGMQRMLWGPDAQTLDASHIVALRSMMARTNNLLEQSWRESVNLAAEALDANNAFGANSEEMSAAAQRCKDLKKELQANFGRIAKLERELLGSATVTSATPIPSARQSTNTDRAVDVPPRGSDITTAEQLMSMLEAVVDAPSRATISTEKTDGQTAPASDAYPSVAPPTKAASSATPENTTRATPAGATEQCAQGSASVPTAASTVASNGGAPPEAKVTPAGDESARTGVTASASTAAGRVATGEEPAEETRAVATSHVEQEGADDTSPPASAPSAAPMAAPVGAPAAPAAAAESDVVLPEKTHGDGEQPQVNEVLASTAAFELVSGSGGGVTGQPGCPPSYWAGLHGRFAAPDSNAVDPSETPEAMSHAEAVPGSTAGATEWQYCPSSYWVGLHARFPGHAVTNTAEVGPCRDAPPIEVAGLASCPVEMWADLHARLPSQKSCAASGALEEQATPADAPETSGCARPPATPALEEEAILHSGDGHGRGAARRSSLLKLRLLSCICGAKNL